MNDSEHSTSFDYTDFLPTCRFLDQCTLLLEPDGCRSCEFALRYNHNSEEIYAGEEELSGTGASSPELIATPEETAQPALPPASLIDR